MRLQEACRFGRPFACQLAVAVQELDDAKAWMRLAQQPEALVSGTRRREEAGGVELQHLDAPGLRLLHTAIGRPAVHVDDREAQGDQPIQATSQTIALVATDHHDAGVSGRYSVLPLVHGCLG